MTRTFVDNCDPLARTGCSTLKNPMDPGFDAAGACAPSLDFKA